MTKKQQKKKIIPLHTSKVRRYPQRNQANPESGARALYELFHGKPSESTLIVTEDVHTHGWLAALGELVEIKFVSESTDADGNAFLVTVEFDGARPMLCSNEAGTQLYIEGGDPPEIDLSEFAMDGPEWLRDSMVLGTLVEITYETEKNFHRFQLIEYYHELGEETDVMPYVILDTLNNRLAISGGQYQIRWEGIVN